MRAQEATMLRNAFFKSLRDQARPLIMWVIGVAFYVALLISIYPSIRHSAASLQGYIDSLPPAVRAAFLGSGGDFSSPVGYVNVELLSWLAPIVFIAFAVVDRRPRPGRRGRERHAEPAADPDGRPARGWCCRSTPRCS